MASGAARDRELEHVSPRLERYGDRLAATSDRVEQGTHRDPVQVRLKRPGVHGGVIKDEQRIGARPRGQGCVTLTWPGIAQQLVDVGSLATSVESAGRRQRAA